MITKKQASRILGIVTIISTIVIITAHLWSSTKSMQFAFIIAIVIMHIITVVFLIQAASGQDYII